MEHVMIFKISVINTDNIIEIALHSTQRNWSVCERVPGNLAVLTSLQKFRKILHGVFTP